MQDGWKSELDGEVERKQRWREVKMKRRAPGETQDTLSPTVSWSPAVQNPANGFT